MERLIADFIQFLALLPIFYFCKGDWVLEYVRAQLRDFTKISSFLKSFYNSWGKSYNQFVVITIQFCFTWGERKLD